MNYITDIVQVYLTAFFSWKVLNILKDFWSHNMAQIQL